MSLYNAILHLTNWAGNVIMPRSRIGPAPQNPLVVEAVSKEVTDRPQLLGPCSRGNRARRTKRFQDLQIDLIDSRKAMTHVYRALLDPFRSRYRESRQQLGEANKCGGPGADRRASKTAPNNSSSSRTHLQLASMAPTTQPPPWRRTSPTNSAADVSCGS